MVAQQNDHLITVKGNQPKLMQQFQAAVDHQVPISQTEAPDRSHGRQLTRRVHVYRASPQLSQTWKNAQSLVVVYRKGIWEQTPFQTVSFS